MEDLVRVSVTQLCQWALDFTGNKRRVKVSIQSAKDAGSRFRTGPELELCGYGCEDHFFEPDTVTHCWECLADILESNLTDGILCDIGMPVLFRSVLYNCRVYCLNRRILLIRPKTELHNCGPYNEMRYFGTWRRRTLCRFRLPACIRSLEVQNETIFGVAIIECANVSIVTEIGNEYWGLHPIRYDALFDGVDIVTHSDSSSDQPVSDSSNHSHSLIHTTPGSSQQRPPDSASVFLYANHVGGDGGSFCYSGNSSIAVNGRVVATASQFTLLEVEVLTQTVDIASVRAERQGRIACTQKTDRKKRLFRVRLPISLAPATRWLPCKSLPSSREDASFSHNIGRAAACWLWDYLRRSGARGFFLPLSGGVDSATVAAIVGEMTRMVMNRVSEGNSDVIVSLETILNTSRTNKNFPSSSRELAYRLLHTCYMQSRHSSALTKTIAKEVANDIGSYHVSFPINGIFATILHIFASVFSCKLPKFQSEGGTPAEDIALQNLQARIRMVLSYLLAVLMWMVRGAEPGFLLVLGTGNRDEALCGYVTKYDCSSADINPIGSLSKEDLRLFLHSASKQYKSLERVLQQQPTAELRPPDRDPGTGIVKCQTDEADIGLTYDELGLFGRLRQTARCGPVSMFQTLIRTLTVPPKKSALGAYADKVKVFFQRYATNRHKTTVLTPGCHLSGCSPDDRRNDHRPMLYPRWELQFQQIDQLVDSVGTHDAQPCLLSGADNPEDQSRQTVS